MNLLESRVHDEGLLDTACQRGQKFAGIGQIEGMSRFVFAESNSLAEIEEIATRRKLRQVMVYAQANIGWDRVSSWRKGNER